MVKKFEQLYGRKFAICNANGIVAKDMGELLNAYHILLIENKMPDVVLLHSSTYAMVKQVFSNAGLATTYTQPKPLYPVNGNQGITKALKLLKLAEYLR